MNGGRQVSPSNGVGANGNNGSVLLTTNSNYCTFKQNSKRHSRNPSFNQNNISAIEEANSGQQHHVQDIIEREKLFDRLKNIQMQLERDQQDTGSLEEDENQEVESNQVQKSQKDK